MTVAPAEAYAVLEAGLDPVLIDQGMKRLRRRGTPVWRSVASEVDGANLFFSLQVDGKATDPYSGQGFRVELEKSRQPLPATGLTGRALFFQLLTEGELAALLDLQNAHIEALPSPPEDQIAVYPEGGVRQQYLLYFQPQDGFDAIRCWLRYRTESDLMEWIESLKPLIPLLLRRARTSIDPDERLLGTHLTLRD